MRPTNPVAVRSARTQDLTEICAMMHSLAAFHGDPCEIVPNQLFDWSLGPRPWIRFIVACGPHALVGYAALQVRLQLHTGCKLMNLEHLFVKEPARGSGIGGALIAAARFQGQDAGCTELTVGTAPGNDRACAFYRAMGFADRAVAGSRFAMPL